jgi:hypothetical protein
MLLEIAIIVFHFVWATHGFCGINTATTVDKHMLLRGSSDIINGKVNQIIQQYSTRNGANSYLIKSCINNKKQEQQKREQQQKQEYMRKKQTNNRFHNKPRG